MTSKASPTESPAKDGAKRALVLFSGGQDSTVCLAWALQRFEAVETVGFSYGQAHSVEMTCREKVRAEIARHFPGWASRLGPDHVLDLAELGRISETSLTSDMEIEMGENGLPNTFVPGRNLLFLTYAAALGYRRGAQALVGGMCETDYSGYPDCRPEFIEGFERLANIATKAGDDAGHGEGKDGGPEQRPENAPSQQEKPKAKGNACAQGRGCCCGASGAV